MSWYINLFGYIQFGGILITPVIGIIFDKDHIGKSEEKYIDPALKRVQRIQESIAPFVITNILCIIFCALGLVEHIYAQVRRNTVVRVVFRRGLNDKRCFHD